MIKRKIFLFTTFLVFSLGFLTYLFFSGNKIFAAIESMDVIKIDSFTPNVGDVSNKFYGFSIANIGDLNDDSVDDVLVGASIDSTIGLNYGAAYIHFMNTDGSVDSTVKLDANTLNGPTLDFDNLRYGWSVAGIGDLNDDGVEDIAIGAISYYNNNSIYTGRVYVHFMNTDGSVDSTVVLDRNTVNGPSTIRNIDGNDYYGSSIDSLGDLNGDGVEDLIVGASFDSAGGSARGAAFIHFMNTDGSIDSTVKINGSTLNGPTTVAVDGYGGAVANIGDLNGDGVIDIAVGADSLADSVGSYFYIHFMNTDGSIDSSVRIDKDTPNGPTGLGNFYNYATSLEGLGDIDGDGIPDLASGSIRQNTSLEGAVYIHYMNSDGTIKETDVLNESTQEGLSLGPTDMYGTGVALLEDYSGDGVVDIAVGTRASAFYIHFIDLVAEMSRTPSVVVSESGNNGVVTVSIDFLSPEEDVEITLNHNSQITLDKTTLTFTPLNWETPQTVTVSAVDDLVDEGSHLSPITYTVSSLDNNFNGLSLLPTTVTIIDNDAPPGVNVSIGNDYGENYDVSEDFIENYLTITLTYENTEDVTITLTPDSELDIEFSGPGVPYDVVIPAGGWNSGALIAVWANDDLDIEGNHVGNISYTLSSLDSNYDGLVVTDTELRIRDNDVGIVVTESSSDTSVVEGGDTDTLNVSLGAAPTEDVLVNVSSLGGELSFSSDVLTFTALNWFEDQTITITAVNDSEIEGNHTDTINFSVSSIDLNYNEYLLDSVGVDIEDNDSLAPDPEPEESRGSSGSILPHIRFKDNIKETDTRFVDLEAWVPGTITYFEISNTPDFKVKETYQREYLQKDLYWDLCKGLDICSYGEKFVYARFYSDFLVPAEDTISIDHKGSCPYFKDYIRMGHKNNKDEVIKVQEFLNRQIGSSLVLDGIVGNKTDRAIRNFQEMYPVQILHPWNGLKTSTGWWYITTKSFANVLMGCK